MRGLGMATLPMLVSFFGFGLVSGLTYAQMTTPGHFQVSETGAAIYSIPIQTPPGIAGMEPKLSLNYSSQGGNGLLGVGWGMSGLGRISRCPRTPAQDGLRGSVNYDMNDRYCLDGQRLIAISGADGADGTQYRTERESFAKIVSYSASGNGPAWFKVWTKAGQVMEYGHSNDSQIAAPGRNTVRVWALNRVQDSAGNYFTASYTTNPGNGDFYPSRVDYSGNSKTAAQISNSIQFVYEARPDVVAIGGPGPLITSVVRLSKINIIAGPSVVREYRLAYSQGPATQRSRLTSVTECAPQACLPPTSFIWEATQPAIQNITWEHGADAMGVGSQLGDLFGEGRQVYWTHDASGIHNATRFFPDGTLQNFVWRNGVGAGDSGGQLADLLGEGQQLYWTHDASGVHNGMRMLPDGTAESIIWQHGAGVGNVTWQIADLFGDGRQMYWTSDNDGTHYATRFNPDGTWLNWVWRGGYGKGDSGSQLIDLFGDGTSVYWTFDKNGTHYSSRLKSDGTVENKLWTGLYGLGDVGWRFADLFGDGHPVYWTFDKSGRHYALRFNSDGTTQQWTWTGGYGLGDGGWGVADLFGEGRQLFWAFDKDGRHYAMRLNPDGTMQKMTWQGGYGVGNAGWQMGDLFGTGRQLYWAHDTNGRHYATSFIANAPDQLLGIRSGLNSAVDISYLPLSDSSVYTKDPRTSFSYPLQDVRMPMYVVSSVKAANGAGGAMTTVYTYGGLKAELGTGRGMLGFRWVQSRQVETGLTSYTEYQQNWPYTGLPALSRKSIAGGGSGGVLSQTMSAYGCSDVSTTGATPCSIGAGKRYFVFAKQSVESSWDYNGEALPVITTSTEYDNWGNATKVDVVTDDGFKKSTINSFSNDGANWYLGRLLRSNVTSTSP